MSWKGSYSAPSGSYQAPYNGAGGSCQTDCNGTKHCYYPGPPAKNGNDAVRHYIGETGRHGNVYDVVQPACHGRDAQCEDRPLLTWPKCDVQCAPAYHQQSYGCHQAYAPACGRGYCPRGSFAFGSGY